MAQKDSSKLCDAPTGSDSDGCSRTPLCFVANRLFCQMCSKCNGVSLSFLRQKSGCILSKKDQRLLLGLRYYFLPNKVEECHLLGNNYLSFSSW